jgi:hypothetical protein
MDDLAKIEEYDRQLMDLDTRTEVMPEDEWPPVVTTLMQHYHGSRMPVLTREQVLEITKRLDKPGLMMKETLPLICVGEGDPIEENGCPYAASCPLVLAEIPPIGSACPFESRMVDEMFSEYISTLNVESNNMVEIGQIINLLSLDLLMHRISGTLSKDGMTDRNPVGLTAATQHPDGTISEDVLYRTDPSAVATLLDKFSLRKQTILKNMLATREMQAKYEHEEKEDAATLIAKLKALREQQSGVQ